MVENEVGGRRCERSPFAHLLLTVHLQQTREKWILSTPVSASRSECQAFRLLLVALMFNTSLSIFSNRLFTFAAYAVVTAGAALLQYRANNLLAAGLDFTSGANAVAYNTLFTVRSCPSCHQTLFDRALYIPGILASHILSSHRSKPRILLAMPDNHSTSSSTNGGSLSLSSSSSSSRPS